MHQNKRSHCPLTSLCIINSLGLFVFCIILSDDFQVTFGVKEEVDVWHFAPHFTRVAVTLITRQAFTRTPDVDRFDTLTL